MLSPAVETPRKKRLQPQLVASLVALALCLLFIATGIPWIDKPGIQTDEALFSAGIYEPFQPNTTVRIFQRDYPVMVMTYVGAVKARIWAMIYSIWPPSAASTRIPSVLLAALSVWWFYRLLLCTLGVRAALAGTALLATDSIYLLTARWDWGPVVIQHVCLTGALLALARFNEKQRPVWLALAFFAFGIAMWDKALFAWSLVGLGVAAAITFPRRILAAISIRNVAVAAAAFAIGAFPLIRYNVRNDFVTFRSNTVWTAEDFNKKLELVGYTIDGGALFGSITRDEWDGPLRPPQTPMQRAVVGVTLAAGMPRSNAMPYLFAAGVLLLPFVWRTPARKAFIFSLLFCVVTWLQMAVVRHGGGGAHHTILLWPLPYLGLAAVLAEASKKLPRAGGAVLAAVVGLACVINLLVTGTYYTNLIRNGGVKEWNDGIYRMADALASIEKKQVCVADWGFFDNLRLLGAGKFDLCVANDPVTDADRQWSLTQISDPGNVFVAYTPGNEVTPGATTRLIEFARSKGFELVNHRLFPDSNGRSLIQFFQFSKR